jgi:hypothetical protein
MSGTDSRHSFYINLPVGALATAIIFFTFSTPQTQRNHPDRKASAREKFLQMDFPRLVLIVGSIQCLLTALYWGGVSKPWDANDVIGCLLGFGLLLLGFVFVEWQQGPYAMLVHKLLKKREVWSGSAFSFFISGSLFVLVYYLPIYFQAILGCTAIESGIRNLALVVPVCKCCPLNLFDFHLLTGGRNSHLHHPRRRNDHSLRPLRTLHDHRILPSNSRRGPDLNLRSPILTRHLDRLPDPGRHSLRPGVPSAHHGSSSSSGGR